MIQNNDNTGKSIFLKQRNSLAIRIWHWTTFMAISASLITVLLGSTLFKTSNNISTVTEQVERKGGQVTKDQAWSVAHEYSDKLWDTHKIIGFVLCFLLLGRMIIEIFQKPGEKIKTRIRQALTFTATDDEEKKELKHYLWVKRGYLIFYLLILIMALTGLGLAFEDVPVLRANHKTFTSIHSFVQYFIYLYIAAHLFGVIKADLYKSKGIVSGMINGGAE